MTDFVLVYFFSLMHIKFNNLYAPYQFLFKCKVIQLNESSYVLLRDKTKLILK
jgi:hypothetical protein